MKQARAASLFAFEGPDGVGKSTLVKAVSMQLRSAGHDVVDGAFPGNRPDTLGRLVYEIHHDPRRFGLTDIPAESLQLLHVAAHLEAIRGWIMNARLRGAIVLLDRFWWSTAAYAAIAGLEEELAAAILQPELLYWRQEPPDVVFLLERGEEFVDRGYLDTHRRLTSEYEHLAASESKVSRVVRTANNTTVDKVTADVIRHIELARG